MNLNVYATSLSQLTDATLPFMFDRMKQNSCLVFEDIDVAIHALNEAK